FFVFIIRPLPRGASVSSKITFMNSPQFFYTSESVTEGHPDKICDQVSDAVLDALIAQDPMSRVACETATTTGLIVVIGEITTNAYADIGTIARDVVRDIGYTRGKFGFDADTCGVMVSIKEQSGDIAQGVNKALEVREMSDDEIDQIGAGDQGMMIGFACNETPEYMPATISLAHKLVRMLAFVRKNSTLPWLRPAGKIQVTVEYEYGRPKRVDTIVISTQHAPEVTPQQIREAVIDCVIRPPIPAEWLDNKTRIYINPTGRFVTGGPLGDAGLTGRKIIVDTYGGIARHGGGAFSGKDPTKVDRSAAYMARYVAKNLVAAGIPGRLREPKELGCGVGAPFCLEGAAFV